MEGSSANIAVTLETAAKNAPQACALRVPHKGLEISFRSLDAESSRLASGFSRLGIGGGKRVLIGVPFSADFIAITFALFKTGAVPVLIDPGLGRKNALQCIEQAQPQAMVAVPLAHAVRLMFPKPFRSVKTRVTAGRRWFWGGDSLAGVRRTGSEDFGAVFREPGDAAAVLFTSGSTGPSKGVQYTHGMFQAQVRILKSVCGIEAGETDLATFPLFGLFSIGMGMTTILPEMDFTRPARVDPEKIIGPIHAHQVSNCFGSPALWDTVSRHCVDRSVRLPTLKRILMAGAPVPGTLLSRFETVLETRANIFTPYGATEALPVASIERREILEETWRRSEQGAGICVGRPVPGMEVKIIGIRDEPIERWSEDLELPAGTIGEIAVKGAWVTAEYCDLPEADRLAKIPDGNGFWHRMGDAGWKDESGRVWFCGRKSHRVVTESETLFTIPCEAVFNRHPAVRRSALVGIGVSGAQRPVLIVEPEDFKRFVSAGECQALIRELQAIGQEHTHTRRIDRFLLHREFPVDVRHNAKIFREKLAVWAETQLKGA